MSAGDEVLNEAAQAAMTTKDSKRDPTEYVVLEAIGVEHGAGLGDALDLRVADTKVEEVFVVIGQTTAHSRRAAVQAIVGDTGDGRYFKAVPASSWQRTVRPKPPAPQRTLWEEVADDG